MLALGICPSAYHFASGPGFEPQLGPGFFSTMDVTRSLLLTWHERIRLTGRNKRRCDQQQQVYITVATQRRLYSQPNSRASNMFYMSDLRQTREFCDVRVLRRVDDRLFWKHMSESVRDSRIIQPRKFLRQTLILSQNPLRRL